MRLGGGAPNILFSLGGCVLLFNSRCPQWTEDEQLCSRNVTNEVHCFDGGQPGIDSYYYIRVPLPQPFSYFTFEAGKTGDEAIYTFF